MWRYVLLWLSVCFNRFYVISMRNDEKSVVLVFREIPFGCPKGEFEQRNSYVTLR